MQASTTSITFRRQLLECLDAPSACVRMGIVCRGPPSMYSTRWKSARTPYPPSSLRLRIRTSRPESQSVQQARRTYSTASPRPKEPEAGEAADADAAPAPISKPIPTPARHSSSPIYFQRSHQRPYFPKLPPNFGHNQSLAISDSTRHTLEQIVAHFKAVRWAVAYGSGVVSQKGYDDDPAKKPLIDFLIATSHPSHFHSINLARNPSHYPLLARWMGSDVIARIQENWGAGVWYATMVQVEGQNIKYGVISMDTLCEDLLDWKTLYAAGRMHKPVRILRQDARVLLANQVNLASVLRVALLSLPEEFTEVQLWEQVAGVSYLGDPRMSVPGGENPRKVQNIVRPQIRRFRNLYYKLLSELGSVRAKDSVAAEKLEMTKSPEESLWLRMGLAAEDGSGVIVQTNTPEHRAGMLKKLPRNLKKALERRYSSKLKMTYAHAGEDADPHAKRLSEDEFWIVVARQDSLKKVIDEEIRRIIRYPAITQTAKGFVTAGLKKSILYASQKVRKWWNSKMATA